MSTVMTIWFAICVGANLGVDSAPRPLGMWVFLRNNPFRTALQENWKYPVFLEVVHHIGNSCPSTFSVASSGDPTEARGCDSCQGPESRPRAFRHRRCRLRQGPVQVDAMRLLWQRL